MSDIKINRCAIVQFYDKDGVVDEYVYTLIRQLSIVSQMIVFVSNSTLSKNDTDCLTDVVDKLVVRENVGCDAGSYRDILVNHLGDEVIRKFDEIVLCNTTFFGFFEPIEEIFTKLSCTDCDFWGIGHSDGGVFTYSQGYFLVFRQNILNFGDLYRFFSELPHISGRHSSSIFFEVGIYKYLVSKGYKYRSYINKSNYYIFGNSAFSVLKDGYPILKKRVFAPEFYDETNLFFLMKQIIAFNLYDINMIIDAVNRSYNLSLSKDIILSSSIKERDVKRIILGKPAVTYEVLSEFVASNNNVYVFGVGFYGMFTIEIMKEWPTKTIGIVVSDGKRDGLMDTLYIKDELSQKDEVLYYKHLPIFELSEIDAKNSSLIVSLDYKNSKTLKLLFKNFKNVLFLWEDV